MKDKLYLKHVLRTVKRKPVQPLLIVLILALSFLITNIGLSTSAAIKEEKDQKQISEFGESEIVITTNTTSSSRFLFSKDVRNILPDASVTGSYTMPYVFDGDFVSGVAVDFKEVENVFGFEFSETLPFPVDVRRSVAFVTADLCEKCGFALGDSITLSAFGKDVTYRICGISDKPFLGNCDIMTDISSTVHILAEYSPMISAAEDIFTPCGMIYVKTSDGDVEGAIEKIRASFNDYTVTQTSEDLRTVAEESMAAISLIIVLLTLICAFAVVFGCTYCLAKERAEDAALFSAAGVSKKKLDFYRHIEMAVYSGVGIITGLLVSYPLGCFTFSLVGFDFVGFRLIPIPCAASALSVLTVAEITPFVFRARASAVVKTKKKHRILGSISPALLVILSVLQFFVAVPIRFYVSVAALMCLFASIFSLFAPFYKKTASGLGERASFLPLRFGAKNAARVDALSNSSRLLLILITVLVPTFFLVRSAGNFNNLLGEYYNADYVIAGGTARTADLLVDAENIDKVYGMFSSSGECQGKSVNVWGISDIECINKKALVDVAPSGDGFVTSRSYAAKYGIEKGDKVTLAVGSKTFELTLTDTLDGNAFFFLVDAEHLGLSYNSYLVKGQDGIEKSEVYSSLTAALSLETVVVAPVTQVVETQAQNELIYLYFGKLLTVFLVFFAFVGIADNLAESYRSRKNEFELYSVCGMKKRQIAKMICFECLFSLLVVVLCTLITGSVAVLCAEEGLMTFGTECFSLFIM